MFTARRKMIDQLLKVFSRQSFADFYDKVYVPYIEGHNEKLRIQVYEDMDMLFRDILPPDTVPKQSERTNVVEEHLKTLRVIFKEHIGKDNPDLIIDWDEDNHCYHLLKSYSIYAPSDKGNGWVVCEWVVIPQTFDTPEDIDEVNIGTCKSFHSAISIVWNHISQRKLDDRYETLSEISMMDDMEVL